MSQAERIETGETGAPPPRLWGRASLFASAAESFRRLVNAIGATFEREMDAGRGFLWLPVAFAVGILIYFALPVEPWLPAPAALALALVVAAILRRASAVSFRVLVVLAAVACGLTAMKVRTDLVAAPVLPREMTATVTGWIALREEAQRNAARIAISVHDMTPAPSGELPELVRITVRSDADTLAFGEAISVRARLQPPNGPVMPGGYDFSRAAFYEGVGAVGFAYGAATANQDIGAPPWSIRLRMPLEWLRDTIRRRVEAALPGDAGHVATALIIGDRRGIAEATQEAMRISGLAHILAISGLHMALVAGSAFWLIRALLALSPSLALRRPIKKWAAAGALAVATFYLSISGGSVATQRAYIMLAVMLIAILLDRRAITLRNVAVAALIVLFMTPEAVLSVSFQMSFAATVALVSGYEAISAWRERRLALSERRQGGFWRVSWRYVAGLFVTSLIAGLATAPFAAFHFQRVAPLTLIANLAAMPAVGFIVMPSALTAVLVMPLGLEQVPLTVMHWGLSWVIGVAHATADWSAGYGGVPLAPAPALVLISAGMLWLALWRERWRLAGLVPIALAFALVWLAPRPDVIVDDEAKSAAIRTDNGRYVILGGRGANFEVENWLRADADQRAPNDPTLKAGAACDPLGCVGNAAGIGTVALVLGRDAFDEDCRIAAVVITPLAAPPGCDRHALVIDRDALGRLGAHAIHAGHNGLQIDTAYTGRDRPFERGGR